MQIGLRTRTHLDLSVLAGSSYKDGAQSPNLYNCLIIAIIVAITLSLVSLRPAMGVLRPVGRFMIFLADHHLAESPSWSLCHGLEARGVAVMERELPEEGKVQHHLRSLSKEIRSL